MKSNIATKWKNGEFFDEKFVTVYLEKMSSNIEYYSRHGTPSSRVKFDFIVPTKWFNLRFPLITQVMVNKNRKYRKSHNVSFTHTSGALYLHNQVSTKRPTFVSENIKNINQTKLSKQANSCVASKISDSE